MNSIMKLFASLLLLFFFSSLLFGEINGVEGSNQHHHFNGRNKLFVFGDSYADTGNTNKAQHVGAWGYPYGITYPGKPSGRFSDGHISIDFLAEFLRIKLPITYANKDNVDKKRLQYGLNFAYGGTGVFDTQIMGPNMTTQISHFQHLLGNIYSPSDLSSSIALVSVAGNDYLNFLAQNRKHPELIAFFIPKVVNQAEVNLRRIHTLGVKKIAIPSLTPLGLIPHFANESSILKAIVNDLAKFHNGLLGQVVAKLNKETNHSTFAILDYYNAFSTVLNTKGDIPGITKFETPFQECLTGKNYTLCDDPTTAFFWDGIHPTQAGWRSVYRILGKTLNASLNKA